MHGEMNKNVCFNSLIQTIVKMCEIAQFTRATPGSSLVQSKNPFTLHLNDKVAAFSFPPMWQKRLIRSKYSGLPWYIRTPQKLTP